MHVFFVLVVDVKIVITQHMIKRWLEPLTHGQNLVKTVNLSINEITHLNNKGQILLVEVVNTFGYLLD